MTARRMDIKEKIILITGAGNGIGLALVEQTLRRGGIPIAVEYERDKKQILEKIIAEHGAVHIADVRNTKAMQKIIAATCKRFGGVDVVIANAGIERSKPIHLMEQKDFENVIETNLLGVYRTIKPALASVMERDGHVLGIASVAALLPLPTAAAYSTAKAGVDMLCRVLRLEFAGNPATNATAGAAYFGYIDTRMGQVAIRNQPDGKVAGGAIQRLLGVGSVHSPDEAAVAILDGIERRSPRVFTPPMLAFTYRMRGMLTILDRLVAGRLAARAKAGAKSGESGGESAGESGDAASLAEKG